MKRKKLKNCIDCGEKLSEKTISRCKECFDYAHKMVGGKNYKKYIFIPISSYCPYCKGKIPSFNLKEIICLKHSMELKR